MWNLHLTEFYHLPEVSSLVDLFVVMVALMGIVGLALREKPEMYWRSVGTMLIKLEVVLYSMLFLVGGVLIFIWCL